MRQLRREMMARFWADLYRSQPRDDLLLPSRSATPCTRPDGSLMPVVQARHRRGPRPRPPRHEWSPPRCWSVSRTVLILRCSPAWTTAPTTAQGEAADQRWRIAAKAWLEKGFVWSGLHRLPVHGDQDYLPLVHDRQDHRAPAKIAEALWRRTASRAWDSPSSPQEHLHCRVRQRRCLQYLGRRG